MAAPLYISIGGALPVAHEELQEDVFAKDAYAHCILYIENSILYIIGTEIKMRKGFFYFCEKIPVVVKFS